jgi:hypothetical protein
LILELKNQPAMPYLLSLLPPQSYEENLNPIPLVAKLQYSSQPLGSMYVRVLGGSRSSGGIALDPLVSSGRLSKGIKVEFAQQRQGYIPIAKRSSGGVNIQLEVLSSISLPGVSKPSGNHQRNNDVSTSPWSTKSAMMRISKGVFSAGSEGGFLVGERGVIPWLCRTSQSRVELQITKAEQQLRSTRKLDPSVRMLQEEKRFANYLEEQSLVVTKQVVFRDDGTWTTQAKISKKGGELPNSQKQESTSHGSMSTMNQDDNASSDQQRKAREIRKQMNLSTDSSQPSQISSRLRDSPNSRLSSLPPKVQRLLERYPATKKLVGQRKIRSLPYHGRWVKFGSRKFSFRARASWFPFREGGFQRSEHRPGVFTQRVFKSRAPYRKGGGVRKIAQRDLRMAAAATSRPKEMREVDRDEPRD